MPRTRLSELKRKLEGNKDHDPEIARYERDRLRLQDQADKRGLKGNEWWLKVANGLLRLGHELHPIDQAKMAEIERARLENERQFYA